MSKLHICVPCYGCRLFVGTLSCLAQLRHEAVGRGVQTTVRMIGNESLVTRARNMMTADFLKTDATHMLFVDADILFNPSDIFEMMDANKDVVCGIYAKKSINWERLHDKEFASEPICQRGIDFNINFDQKDVRFSGKFCKVLDAATGLMLIKRQAIEKLYTDHPYLNCINDMPDSGMQMSGYCAIFDCMIDPDSRRYLSEDYAFCRRAQWSGLEVWAMMSCVTGHIGSMHVDANNPMLIEQLKRRYPPTLQTPHDVKSSPLPDRIRNVEDLRQYYESTIAPTR